MIRFRLLAGLLAALAALAFSALPARAQGDGFQELVTFLTGSAEVNAAGEPNQGDPDGSGTARLAFSVLQKQICVNIAVRDVDQLTLAHIHRAPAGSNGPVVVDFTSLIRGSRVLGCVAADPNLIEAILADPAGYYVNTHNAAFPAGALRGNLEPEGSLLKTFSPTLTGDQEVGTPGDPDGLARAYIEVFAPQRRICVDIRAVNVAPLTLAHIHNAPAGSNGGVVVNFTQFIDGGKVRGCVTVEPNLLNAIRTSPQNYYFNVHNAEFPAGALRGQLQ